MALAPGWSPPTGHLGCFQDVGGREVGLEVLGHLGRAGDSASGRLAEPCSLAPAWPGAQLSPPGLWSLPSESLSEAASSSFPTDPQQPGLTLPLCPWILQPLCQAAKGL